jgi:uncharacterized protein (TIGR03435 family)
MMPVMFSRLSAAVLLLCAFATVFAQQLGRAAQRENPSPAPQLEFEVATVKVVHPDQRGRVRVECAGGNGSFVFESGVISHYVRSTVPRGRCLAESVPLRTLIAVAYDVPAQQVSGIPDWPDVYTLEGKAENPAVARKEDLAQMLQSLLSDRFKLKIHIETKESDGYVLLVSANGVKFKELSSSEQLVGTPRGTQITGRLLRLSGGFRLKQFANFLSGPGIAGLPVLDQTNLPGTYDISFTLNHGPGRGPGSTVSFDPPLTRAVEEQLGLKLERKKVPMESIVVDRVEKPSAN